jgi:hypothetical protein
MSSYRWLGSPKMIWLSLSEARARVAPFWLAFDIASIDRTRGLDSHSKMLILRIRAVDPVLPESFPPS